MNSNFASQYIKNTLLTIALCMLYHLFSGLGSMLAALCISSCLGMVFYHEHYGKAITNVLLVVIIFTLGQGVVSAFINSIPIFLIALSLNFGARLRLPLEKMVLVCFILYVADIVLNLELASYASDGELTLSSMMLGMGEELRALPQLQSSDPAVKNMTEEVIRTVVDLSVRLSPAVFMVISALFAYGVVSLYKHMQQKRGVDMNFWPPFRELHAHWILGVLYLLLGMLLLSAPQGYFFDLTLNVLLVMTFLFAALGISVLVYKSKMKPGRRRGKWILFFILCMTGMALLPLLVFLCYGLTDSFFDYRKLTKQKKEQ